MNCFSKKRVFGQSGAAVVEFAVTLPLLLMIMLATEEIGRAFYQYNTLIKAVRDGARYLSENSCPSTCGQIDITNEQVNTRNVVVYGNRSGNGSPVLEHLSTGDITISQVDDQHVRVSAKYIYRSILGGTIPTFGYSDGGIDSNFTFNVQNTMRAIN